MFVFSSRLLRSPIEAVYRMHTYPIFLYGIDDFFFYIILFY